LGLQLIRVRVVKISAENQRAVKIEVSKNSQQRQQRRAGKTYKLWQANTFISRARFN